MVGIVIATHGSLAEGLKSGIELLVGPQGQFRTVGLFHGDDPAQFKKDVEEAVQAADTGDGVLCYVDVLGGTPSNVVMQLIESHEIQALAGTNLPMVIQGVFMRETLGLEALASEALKAGGEAVTSLNARISGDVTASSVIASEVRQAEDMSSASASEVTRPGAGEVVLCRIDDRLIHGQVMTSWLHATGANKIMIVDDETAQNPFLKTVFKSAVPSGIGVGVFNEAKAADRLKKGFKPSDRVIVLAKYPQTFESLVKRGAHVPAVIIGGMGSREDRSKFYRNISASEDEKRSMQALIDAGVEVDIQILADDGKVDVSKLLK